MVPARSARRLYEEAGPSAPAPRDRTCCGAPPYPDSVRSTAAVSGRRASKEATVEADKIMLEPTEDGKRWRVKLEGGDVEGHQIFHFTIEPAGEVDSSRRPLPSRRAART